LAETDGTGRKRAGVASLAKGAAAGEPRLDKSAGDN